MTGALWWFIRRSDTLHELDSLQDHACAGLIDDRLVRVRVRVLATVVKLIITLSLYSFYSLSTLSN